MLEQCIFQSVGKSLTFLCGAYRAIYQINVSPLIFFYLGSSTLHISFKCYRAFNQKCIYGFRHS
jgi:hypothetical protein